MVLGRLQLHVTPQGQDLGQRGGARLVEGLAEAVTEQAQVLHRGRGTGTGSGDSGQAGP